MESKTIATEPTMTADTPQHPQGQVILDPPTTAVLYRRAVPDDAAFIFSYWLRDYYERSRFAKGISKDTFMRLHHLVLERIISRSVIFVACDPEAPDVAYGFICGEPPGALHYVYVKRRFRRMGIARALMDKMGWGEAWGNGGPQIFTHLTDDGITLRRKYPLAEYVPYAV